jgi:hypothetical protein
MNPLPMFAHQHHYLSGTLEHWTTSGPGCNTAPRLRTSPTLHTGQLLLCNPHGGDAYTVILSGRILVCVSEVSALSLLRQGVSDRDLGCTHLGMRCSSPQRLLQCSRATSDLPQPSSHIRRCNKAAHSLRIARVRVGEHGAG